MHVQCACMYASGSPLYLPKKKGFPHLPRQFECHVLVIFVCIWMHVCMSFDAHVCICEAHCAAHMHACMPSTHPRDLWRDTTCQIRSCINTSCAVHMHAWLRTYMHVYACKLYANIVRRLVHTRSNAKCMYCAHTHTTHMKMCQCNKYVPYYVYTCMCLYTCQRFKYISQENAQKGVLINKHMHACMHKAPA